VTQTEHTPADREADAAEARTAETSEASARLREFEREIGELRVTGGSAAVESRMLTIGVVAAFAGLVMIALGWWGASGTAALNDQISYLISGGLFGIGVTAAGVALYLRYSAGRFLRFWLIRLIYEQRAQTDRIVEALERDRRA